MNAGRWWTIVKRELASYFNSSIAYIFLCVFVALTGVLFMSQFFLVGRAEMRVFFDFLPTALCVFLSAVTMRLWAEEKRGNTYELLLTFPMQPHELVLGKFAASFLFFTVALAATWPIPALLALLGRPDFGPILGGYWGGLCLGGFLLALGLFISGLCRDQIVAFIVAMLSGLVLVLIGTEFVAGSIDSWVPGAGSFLRRFLGLSSHLASFQKGVLDLRDVLYFVVGTGLLLVLNGFWIEGRLRPQQRRLFTLTAAIGGTIFLLTNWLFADISLGRIDMTEGRIYTVSPVTKEILGRLRAPVTIKYYVSPAEKMPTGLKTLEADVIAKLEEFQVASSGRVTYKVFHMEAANVTPFGAADDSLEASLQRKGVRPFQVQSIEADEVGVRLVYSALGIAYKERAEEILPSIIPDNLHELEYLVMSRLFRMALPRTPIVALVAPYKDQAVDPQLQALLEQLGQSAPGSVRNDEYRLIPMALRSEGYDVRRVQLTEDSPLPDGADALVLLEPIELSTDQQRDIQRFLAEGGSVLLAAQRYLFSYGPSATGELQAMPAPQDDSVQALTRPWGLTLENRVLIDEQSEVLNIPGGARLGPFAMSVPVKAPMHVLIGPDGMNQEVSITSRLDPILYLWGSAWHLDEARLAGHGLEVGRLLQSSPYSWLVPRERFTYASTQVGATSGDPQGPFPLAVLVRGQFPSPGEDEAAITPSPGKLLAIGAFTLFQEQWLQQPGHLQFFLNGVDALTLGDELIRIRSKRPIDRSLGRVSPVVKAFARGFVSLFMPALIVVFGVVRLALRSRAKSRYLKQLEVTS